MHLYVVRHGIAIDREDPNAVALAQSMAGIICPPPQGKS